MARRFVALDGVDDTLRQLSSMTTEIRAGLVAEVRKATEHTLAAARAAAPVGRVNGGTTRNALASHYFDDGETGAVYVGPMRDPAGRFGRGMRPKNLPIWIEYGTRRVESKPFLTPAARSAANAFQAATLRVVTNAVKAAE